MPDTNSSSSTSNTSYSYPRKVSFSLALELEIQNAEQDSYIFASPQEAGEGKGEAPTLQIGFIADLFDLLNFEASLGVEKINGFNQSQIAKTLKAGI